MPSQTAMHLRQMGLKCFDAHGVQVCCQLTFAAFKASQLLSCMASGQPQSICAQHGDYGLMLCMQVCCQPTFAAFEDSRLLTRIAGCCSCTSSPTSKNSAYSNSSSSSNRNAWVVSLLFRCVYVAFTTLIAVALPVFAVILGLVAALTFYQTGVLYPVLLHRKVFPRRPAAVLVMNGVLLLAAVVTAMVVVGSVAVVVMSASRLSPLRVL